MLAVILITAGYIDLRYRQIPSVIILLLFIIGGLIFIYSKKVIDKGNK